MKKHLVVALIEGTDIDNDAPETLETDLTELLESDFADSAKVRVFTLPDEEGDSPEFDYDLVVKLADKLKTS